LLSRGDPDLIPSRFPGLISRVPHDMCRLNID